MKMLKPPNGKLERITDKWIIGNNCPLEPCVSKNYVKWKTYFVTTCVPISLFILYRYFPEEMFNERSIKTIRVILVFLIIGTWLSISKIVTNRINEHIEFMRDIHKEQYHIVENKSESLFDKIRSKLD